MQRGYKIQHTVQGCGSIRGLYLYPGVYTFTFSYRTRSLSRPAKALRTCATALCIFCNKSRGIFSYILSVTSVDSN